MAGDIGERFLGDPIEHRSTDAVQSFNLGKDREMNVDARPFREVFHIRMKGGNKPQFVQEHRAQFTSEAMHDSHRFFHKLLRAGDFLLETIGVDRGLLCQGRQTDVDSRQGLGDFVMKLAADLLSFFLLRRQNLVRQMPQMFLHVTRLLQQQAVMLLAFRQGFLSGFASDDFMLQLPANGAQLNGALAQRLVHLVQVAIGLQRGAMIFTCATCCHDSL